MSTARNRKAAPNPALTHYQHSRVCPFTATEARSTRYDDVSCPACLTDIDELEDELTAAELASSLPELHQDAPSCPELDDQGEQCHYLGDDGHTTHEVLRPGKNAAGKPVLDSHQWSSPVDAGEPANDQADDDQGPWCEDCAPTDAPRYQYETVTACTSCDAIGNQLHAYTAPTNRRGEQLPAMESTTKRREHVYQLATRLNFDQAADKLLQLDLATSVIESAEQLRRELVEDLRTAEVSWTKIGQQLGLTKQAAQQRYGKKPTGPAKGDSTLPGL